MLLLLYLLLINSNRCCCRLLLLLLFDLLLIHCSRSRGRLIGVTFRSRCGCLLRNLDMLLRRILLWSSVLGLRLLRGILYLGLLLSLCSVLIRIRINWCRCRSCGAICSMGQDVLLFQRSLLYLRSYSGRVAGARFLCPLLTFRGSTCVLLRLGVVHITGWDSCVAEGCRRGPVGTRRRFRIPINHLLQFRFKFLR